ncbi:MAG: acylneuraminate cytidylyltransferase family protein [Vicinamibacterales bacterium]
MPESILAVIPARGGSKRVPRKNLRIAGGKPLIAWSIEQALAASTINRTIVTTDDDEIAAVARDYGAEVPFLRPDGISGDLAPDLEVFTHLLEWLRDNEGVVPEVCVHLRPTYPLRHVTDIDAMVRLLLEHPELDAVRSVTESDETPFKMWFRHDTGRLAPVVTSSLVDPWNMPRQQLPVTYSQNASIDVVWSRVVLERRSMTGTAIHGYVMDANFDIDTEADLQRVSDRLEALNRHD